MSAKSVMAAYYPVKEPEGLLYVTQKQISPDK